MGGKLHADMAAKSTEEGPAGAEVERRRASIGAQLSLRRRRGRGSEGGSGGGSGQARELRRST